MLFQMGQAPSCVEYPLTPLLSAPISKLALVYLNCDPKIVTL